MGKHKSAINDHTKQRAYSVQPLCGDDGNVERLMVATRGVSKVKAPLKAALCTYVHVILSCSLSGGRQLIRTCTPLCISPLQLQPSTKTASFMYCSKVAGALPRPANATTLPLKSGQPSIFGRGLKSAASQGCSRQPRSQHALSHQKVTAGYMRMR